jgi:signal transduction histidine kinase
LLKTFQLLWVPDLVDDVLSIVSELVANACKHGGDTLPAGSLTIWHPNRRLIIAVHDKNPYLPWPELAAARKGMSLSARAHYEDGRGLAIVHQLAERHIGDVAFASDGDTVDPGKVTTVNMLLPDVCWPHQFKDPWATNRSHR